MSQVLPRVLICGERTLAAAIPKPAASPSDCPPGQPQYACAFVAEPAAALAEARADRCDCVLADARDPRFLELAAGRRAGDLAVPLIACVADATPASARAALLAGADEVAAYQDHQALAAVLARATSGRRGRAAAEGDPGPSAGFPGIVFEADAATLQCSAVSGAAESVLGHPLAEWLGSPSFWDRHVLPQDREHLRACQLLPAGRRMHEARVRMRARDGRLVPLRLLAGIGIGGDGRRRLHGILIEADAEPTAAPPPPIDAVPGGLRVGGLGTFVVDLVAGTTQWDATLQTLYGRTWDPRDGADPTAFVRWVHADDRERVATGLRHLLETGEPVRQEFRYLRGDGATIWVIGSVCSERDADGRTRRLFGATVDITDTRVALAMHAAQNEVLGMIAGDAPLPTIMHRLLTAIEEQDPRMRTSILILGESGRYLHYLAAPRLGQRHADATAQLTVAPDNGSCGAAAFHRRATIVDDTRTSPLFARIQEFCDQVEIRASWSFPIVAASGQLLGTFAVYLREPGVPTAAQERLMRTAVDTAAVCIARHKAAESVARSLERLDLALAAAHMGVFEWDLQQQHVHWSPECRALLRGDGPLVADASVWRRHVHADDRDRVLATFASAVARGGDFRATFRLAGPDDDPRHVECTGRVVSPERGPRRLIGTLRDVTAARRAADALRASEERFQLALRGAQDGLWDWNLATDYLYLSAGCRAMLGYDDDEFHDHFDTFRALLHPDDLPAVLAGARAVVEGRTERFETEFRLRHHDGRWIDILSRAFVVRDAHGRPHRLVGTHVDITPRKRAEQALRDSEALTRRLVETAIDAVVTIDADGIVRQWNPVAETMFGWHRADAVGRSLAELVLPAADREPFRAALLCSNTERAQARPGHRTERRALRADGTEFPVEVAVSSAVMGERVFYHAFVRDITERREAERVRASLEEQLRQAQKLEAIGTLAGGIAHDFNNILAAIQGNSEVLQFDPALGEEQRARARGIHTAAQRGAALVRQILTFSRSSPPSRQVLAPGLVVREACAMLRATLPAHVEIEADIADDVPAIEADPMQIQQVLVNLCTNSWHALGDAGGRIEVTLAAHPLAEPERIGGRTLPPGDYACLTVVDHGVGMTEAVRERIFEPFFTTKPQDQGTGLGLAVVHGIVTAHDGAIEVETAPGQGTRIAILLPATKAEPTVLLPSEPPRRSGSGRRVLYLDDETMLAELAGHMLRRLGYVPLVFSDPAAALATVRAAPGGLDAVITDHSMPGMSGLEFAAAVRALHADLPIVLSSGYVTPDVLDEAHGLAIRHFLAKPHTLSDLEQVLAAALQIASGEEPAPA